jgi:hypothetical protein
MAVPANAGEFAARWNAATPDGREEFVVNLNRAFADSARCFEEGHRGRIEFLEIRRDQERLAVLRRQAQMIQSEIGWLEERTTDAPVASGASQ